MNAERQLKREELEYEFRTTLLRKLKPRIRKELDNLVDDLAWDLMDHIPRGAFEYDERYAHQEGHLFFHGVVSRSRCEAMQLELMSCHLSLPKGKHLTLSLSSPGGAISYGLGVIGVIHRIQRDGRVVNVHVSGEASSMGSVILQAGSHRSMDESAILMLHESSWGMHGKLREHQDALEGSLKEYEALLNIYSQRTGETADHWRERLERRELYMDATEALTAKLVDEVVKSPFH